MRIDTRLSPFFPIFRRGEVRAWERGYVQQRYLTSGLSTHRHFSTKLMLITARSSTITQHLHSFKFILVNKSHSQHCGWCPLRRTPFSDFVSMRTCSLVPRPNTTIDGLGTRLVHKPNRRERFSNLDAVFTVLRVPQAALIHTIYVVIYNLSRYCFIASQLKVLFFVMSDK